MCENMDEAEQSLSGEKLSAEQHGEASLAEKDSIAAEAGYKLGMLSYEAEMSRYDSLISATSHLMTFVSIESIALVTLLATLLEHSSLSPCLIAIWYLIIFALLIATLAIALIARLRFCYMAPAAPVEYGTRVKEHFPSLCQRRMAHRSSAIAFKNLMLPFEAETTRLVSWLASQTHLRFRILLQLQHQLFRFFLPYPS